MIDLRNLAWDVVQPCDHGYVLDGQRGRLRVQVRVFVFEEALVPGTAESAEYPRAVTAGEAVACIEAAVAGMEMQAIREEGGVE